MTAKQDKNSDEILKRDLLRDFCLAAASLQEQFARFDASGNLSFSIISEVVGSEVNKGLLWRTKDAAAHLFGGCAPLAPGSRLGWCIGFLFHEGLQMLEAAYQLQHYSPKLAFLVGNLAVNNGKAGRETPEQRLLLLSQRSRAGLKAHINRVRKLMRLTCEFFCAYLVGEAANRPLARLIYEREDLLRQVFGPLYPSLLDAVYGQAAEAVFAESALSLAETGKADQAATAARQALQVNPGCPNAGQLLEIIEKFTTGGKPD
jgi:hypothetical protein